MLTRTSWLIKAISEDLIPFQRSVNCFHLFLNTASQRQWLWRCAVPRGGQTGMKERPWGNPRITIIHHLGHCWREDWLLPFDFRHKWKINENYWGKKRESVCVHVSVYVYVLVCVCIHTCACTLVSRCFYKSQGYQIITTSFWTYKTRVGILATPHVIHMSWPSDFIFWLWWVYVLRMVLINPHNSILFNPHNTLMWEVIKIIFFYLRKIKTLSKRQSGIWS